ncbi:MFS transporter [Asaia prunellae]|uniref:MFS transporter n=1 Tax=Asaia prunellae TaxID=610245 RepID=UPI000686FF18|nr:MFS transporter [Asaia prunellae]
MPSNPPTSSHPGVWRQLLALVALSAVGSVMPLGAPALAGVLARGFALSPSQVGLYFLSELGATSLVSLPAILLVRYVPLRRAMAMAVAGFVVFNLLSWFAGSYAWLLALRVGASAAGGTVMILTMTGIARLPRQEVGFGAWVAGQLMLSALVILAFPVIADHIGVQGVYVFVALLMAGAAVTLPWLPASVAPGAAEVGVSVDILGTGLRIGGVLLFYLAIAGIWTFLEKSALIPVCCARALIVPWPRRRCLASLAACVPLPWAVGLTSAALGTQRWH